MPFGAAMHPLLRLVVPGLALAAGIPAHAADFSAALADPAWDGQAVPAGQQCLKFKGRGSTPALAVKGIPAGTTRLVMEFSDRSFAMMDHGGHGKVGFDVAPGTTAVSIPSAPGQTLDLPAGFVVVAPHRAPTWDQAGAYLPPCSGGKGNAYYVTVKAVAGAKELASTVVEMGKY